MLAHVNGLVAEKGENMLVIDCGGVGYQLTVSAATLAQAPAAGEMMKCFTYLSVREDAVELFGFATREEKKMFLKLTGVSGIGPKSAIQVLSAMSVHDLSLAIVTGDAKALARAPGIGKKTAQRIVLELKDKVEQADLSQAGGASIPAAPVGNAQREAQAALQALGYTSAEAARAVNLVRDQADTVDALVMLALKQVGSL